MNKFKQLGALAGVLLLTGCASITGDTVQSMRVETRLADGTEVLDADCELFNEHGTFRVKTPGSVMIRRSSSDLNMTCRKEGQPEAKGSAVSRANSGMWGNIIFGGGIGAVIDHTKGTAYTYPQWVQLIFGKLLAFDRSDDKDGQPSLARDVSGTSKPAAAVQAAPATPGPVTQATPTQTQQPIGQVPLAAESPASDASKKTL